MSGAAGWAPRRLLRRVRRVETVRNDGGEDAAREENEDDGE